MTRSQRSARSAPSVCHLLGSAAYVASNSAGGTYPKLECKRLLLYTCSMNSSKLASAEAYDSYSLRYTSSCFKVLKKLSALALSYGLLTDDMLICAPICSNCAT